MRFLSAGVKVGVLVLVFIVGAYGVWKSIGTKASGSSSMGLSALFRDASGLPVGSRVMVAGLPVGEISDLSIEGRYARVEFRIRDDVAIWDNSIVFKKSSSLLGSYYLEVDPGTPTSLDSRGAQRVNTRLVDGDTIDRVVEATSPDALMKRIEESLPNVDKVLLSIRDLSEDMREVVNGPLASTAARIDDLVQRESDTVSRILARADSSMGRIEAIAADIRRYTKPDNQVDKILDELESASKEARELVVSARKEVEETGDKVREKLDLVDEVLASTNSVAKKLDGDEGTLGRLINDSAIADNVEEITDDAKGFVKTLTGMQTYLGLRSEYNMAARLARHYVTLELATRPDKYYYMEFEFGPRGQYPVVTLEHDPRINPNQYYRKVVIEDKIRFTFQAAKRIGWATFRYGIKESTGGVGFDINTTWLGRNLRINTDLFDTTFDQLPRLKITAAYELFKNIYVLGGVDEALNEPEVWEADDIINTGNPDLDEPIQFNRFVYGRDYFLGAMLRINDRDIAALMTVGGSVLSGTTD